MISATILTKNSGKRIGKTLESIRSLDEALIYDNGSTDDTLAIASQFPNVVIYQGSFEGFGATHNKASQLARHDWILSLDSDEEASPEMMQEIGSLVLESDAVYSFPRKNFYNDKWIKWCGWHPDRQARLYHRQKTRFSDAQVHEAILCSHLRQISLRSPIFHYSYASTADFLSKMQIYSDLFALQREKEKSSFSRAIGHGLFAFFKSYLLKRGFLGGKEGFIISLYNANTAFYKYLKLWERQGREKDAFDID